LLTIFPIVVLAGIEDFISGNYQDLSGNSYFVNGPTPSTNGRLMWSVVSPDIGFNAVWETEPASGNTIVGRESEIINNPGFFSDNSSYGEITNRGSSCCEGYQISTNIISAMQIDNTITITGRRSDGSSEDSISIIFVESQGWTGATLSSDCFLPGEYQSVAGDSYSVVGPTASVDGRSTYLIQSTATGFSAIWETGSIVGNTIVGNESEVQSNPENFPLGLAYGEVTNRGSSCCEGYQISTNIISAMQIGNTITITGRRSDGSSEDSITIYNDSVAPNIDPEVCSEVLLDLIFDIDGNGTVDALTDGLLNIRYMFGFTGNSLTDGAVAPDCIRCDSNEITSYLDDVISVRYWNGVVY
jgi:hypothetical protein